MKLTDESQPYGDRALYFHALRNLGLGSTIDSLLEFISVKTFPLNDEQAQDLKVYIINSLSNYKNQQKVLSFL